MILARRLAPQPQALASERGAFLIETLVGAVLVAIVAVAMFSAIDGVNQASGRTKGRAMSASLAQNDQERMRSMPVSMLSNLRQTQVKPINGVNYNVDSRADWISDGTSTRDCTDDGKSADYIKITTKVTPTSQPGVQPVTVTSIVTPAPGTFLASQGSLALTIVDRNGAGVPNLAVTITGPATVTDTTDANGCVFFGYEPVGSYVVTASRAGWVDTMGRSLLTATVNIASQQISTKSLSYDQAGSASVTFQTVATDFGVTGDPHHHGHRTRAAHDALPHGPAGDPQRAGAAEQRRALGQRQRPGDHRGRQPLPLHEPLRDLRGRLRRQRSRRAEPGADRRHRPDQPRRRGHADRPPAGAEPPRHRSRLAHPDQGHELGLHRQLAVRGRRILNAQGNLKFPGLPYGSYSVCADNGGGASSRKFTVSPANNFLRAGTALINVPVPTSGATGAQCS